MTTRTRLLTCTVAGVLTLTACSSQPTATSTTTTSSSSTSSAPSSSTPAASSSSPAATETTTSTETPSAAQGPIPLTRDVPKNVTAGSTAHDRPYLAWTVDSSCRPTIVDRDGIDQWKQATTTCQLTSANNLDPLPGTDAVATTERLDRYTAQLKQQAAGVARPDTTAQIASTYGPAMVFAQRRVDYTRPDNGAQWSTVFSVRRLTGDEVLLTINLSCPTRVLDADPQLLQRTLATGRVASALHPR